jgi:predicted transposase/invertase (TIGR01784 family)
VLAFPPAGVVTAVEILNPFHDKEALDDKLSILDIKARDAAGRQFNVEMQVLPYAAYPQRIVFYLTKLHQQQLREGEPYGDLAPSYSISFLNHVLVAERSRWHWRFQLRDPREPDVLFSDQLELHIVELPKFNRSATELTTGCERWSYFLRHGDELDTERLPEPLQTPTIRKAMEVLRMLTQSELEREKYEARLKYQRDELSRRLEAEQRDKRIQEAEQRVREGEQRVREAELRVREGEQRVREGEQRLHEVGQRGELLGRVRLTERLLKQEPIPKETLQAMTSEQLQELAERLEAQLIGQA